MIPSIANPTVLVVNDYTLRVYFLWRFYCPATHPIHFAADSSDKIIAALRGRYFSLWELYLENFMSRLDVIPTFRQRRCTNRGRNFVRSKRWPTYMSSTTSTYFLRLNNSETTPGNAFWAQRWRARTVPWPQIFNSWKFSVHPGLHFSNSCEFSKWSCWGVPAPNPAE